MSEDTPRDAAPLPPARPAPPRRAVSHPWRWLVGVVAALVLLVALGVGMIFWALTTTAGTGWALSLAPGVTVAGAKGALIGDFSAEQLDAVIPGTGTVTLAKPSWQGLRLHRGDAGRWLLVTIDRLQVDRVDFVPSPSTTPTTKAPLSAPSSLRLPLEVIVRDASIGAFRYGGADAVPVEGVHLALHLGADGGALHRFDALAASYDKVQASGSAQIGADAPFAVEARLGIVSAATVPAFRAGVAANGPLAALSVAATARVDASATHGAQSLDADAVVQPFAAWPLGSLHASTQALDLSALVSAAPATSLSGSAVVVTRGLDQPAEVSVDLVNARAGRLGEGLLPVRRIRAELRGQPAEPDVLDVQTLTVDLGSDAVPGGRLTGSGRWTPARATLDVALDKVRPAALDARAPLTTLDGTMQIVGSGLAGGADTAAVDVVAKVAGQLLDPALPRAAPRNARVHLEAHASASAIDLRSVEATLGDASATLSGKLARANASAPWRATGKLAVAGFDPAPWWPGAAGTGLGRGPNALNAKGTFDLVLPAASTGTVFDALNATRGQAALAIERSVVAGVPIEGQAAFVNDDGQARPKIDIVAAGNRLSAEGRVGASAKGGKGARGNAGTRDQWQLTIDAPQLARLAPLLATAGSPAGRPAARPVLSGTLNAKARIDGRWPDVTSDGELHATALHYGDIAVGRAEGRWHLASADNAKIEATLAIDNVTTAGRTIQQVRARLDGTARAHRATLRIESQALPPAWVDALVARAAATGTTMAVTTPAEAASAVAAGRPAPARVAAVETPPGRSEIVVSAEGGLVDARGERLAGWRGRIGELAARSVDAPRRTWLQARDVRGSVFWGGGPLRVHVDPGSAEALGATLRWSRIDYQGAAGPSSPTRLDVQATIDPVAIAPILQQFQPDLGWTGDLAVGARIDVHSTGPIRADIVVERARGDLAVSQDYGTQSLGLTMLRAAVTGDNGVWRATARLAGSSFGTAAADVTARTASAAAWPDAATPIAGTLDVRIANVATLSTWIPAGWRLGGALRASATIGGRLGAPTYTGRLEGSGLSARNFLQGVYVSDGELAVTLAGETAHIEKFTAKGGKGLISITGDAALGAAPTAELKLVADKFQLLGRVDRRIVASGSAALRLDAKAIGLSGKFKVDEGLIDFTRSEAPTLGDDVEVIRRPRGAPSPAAETKALAATPAEPPVGRKVDLDLRIDVGEQLRVRGRGLDASLRGELHITSPAGRIAVDGSIRAVDGTYQAYGQKLAIDRAVISFSGSLDNPRLDVEATRHDLDVRVGVAVTGTVLNPRVRLFSEPEMSDVDKLSWLVLGKASTSAGGNETALLQRAALGLLSGEGPGVTDRVTKALGLDELSVRSGEGGARDTIVSVGKQISKRWYVGYEQGLNSTAGSWQLIYRLAQRFTVKAQAGGDNAVDVNWTLRWK
ncbi:MAG: translocation/assembly module TamB domain-containing protein [Caldimonas sp.]